jgi:protein involved in plasmid replication-relaxation
VSQAQPRSGGLPENALEVLASVAQHRLLTTAQVQAIHLPGRGQRWAQRVLVRLAAAGLIAHVHAPGGRRRLWFITERGAELAAGSGALDREPKVMSAADAAGQLHAHTLAVNDAAICFLSAARERGDEFGALSWRHEVAHPLTRGRGRRRRQLLADALLSYLLVSESEVAVEQRFLELDRATLPVDRLAQGLARYAHLHRARDEHDEPLWRTWYPAFPPVLCVLAGAPREVLERRRDTAIALCQTDPELARTLEVAIWICLLEDLQRHGPFAPIFLDAHHPERPVDWLGESHARSADNGGGR